MDWTSLVGLLFLVTLAAGVAIAFFSKRRTEDRIHDPSADKSTLAEDKDSHGKPADT
ncbi:MAG: hypothetical protein P1U53_01315 [Sulfitobacter sp.]|nr:hypothetical protein [Sulfitobacter sp.]